MDAYSLPNSELISGSFPVSLRRWKVSDKYLVPNRKLRWFLCVCANRWAWTIIFCAPPNWAAPLFSISHTKFTLFRHHLKHDASQVSHSGKRKRVSLCAFLQWPWAKVWFPEPCSLYSWGKISQISRPPILSRFSPPTGAAWSRQKVPISNINRDWRVFRAQ